MTTELGRFVGWSIFVILELAFANALWKELTNLNTDWTVVVLILAVMYLVLPEDWKPRLRK